MTFAGSYNRFDVLRISKIAARRHEGAQENAFDLLRVPSDEELLRSRKLSKAGVGTIER